MERALAQAAPRGPASVPGGDPGAVLALACHCVMVDAGMKARRGRRPAAAAAAAARPPAAAGRGADPRAPPRRAAPQCVLPSGAPAAARWPPPAGWAAEFADEWVFRYAAPGKASTLVLHCSLQRATGRMLVHTLEAGNEQRNHHMLGLYLPKYVPPGAAALLGGAAWAGVVAHGDALAGMMADHVIAPLLDAAEDLPPGAGADAAGWADGGGSRRAGWAAWLPGGGGASYVLPAVVATAVALSVVAYVVAARRRAGPGAPRR
ncbi:hypothetical protein HT031_002880 [Scenedesmus sp. PABB004]|nr:hypothetical protein HT031_002880 [Scenedesmus sp. PABB004]